ncbi:phosphopantetheine-binding protein [Streptomyces sp. DW26H14]|uniref:phosphopantetheine-binding protein n=1 Tax=Streptomyces sp. DW26H14 TaxID=3435395 RepID=UPI00403E2EAB
MQPPDSNDTKDIKGVKGVNGVNGREDLARVVRTAISGVLGVEPEDIDDATDLLDDYGIDSLELMEVGARLEKALAMKIPVSDLTSARTVGQAIDLLARRLTATAPTASPAPTPSPAPTAPTV